MNFRSTLLATTLLLLGSATPLTAQRVSGTPKVRTTDLGVRVRILDGVATTTLTQTIRNAGNRPAEAIWLLPLPEGAVADGFEMNVNGVSASGDVLDAGNARRVYEDIVRRMRDPGLLEYMGRGCLRARIFPIPAGGEVGVSVTYRHVLPRALGLSRWSLPLQVAGVAGTRPDRITLEVTIDSKRPLRNAFSPDGKIEIVQIGERSIRASMECTGAELPARELSIQYGLSEEDFGLDLLSTRLGAEESGTFLMLISPKREWSERDILPREITFVLDTSGSMAGDKIEQARAALRFFLQSLRPTDRFNVIPFSTGAQPFFADPVPATPENLDQALQRTKGVEARGGTNIDEALRSALGRSDTSSSHLRLVVFLTDGLPTIGVTDPTAILADVEKRNSQETRIFVLGVGHDVNTHLLDKLASSSGGTRDYVRPEESIEERASSLFQKLSHPVMTDLELAVEGIELLDTVPARLGDLFQGERIELLGRYHGEGPRLIRLSGRVGGERREYVYEGTFSKGLADAQGFLPSLWAERRVGLLLDAIRLNGADPELVAEVRRIGRRYRIVTPYSSHLILEEDLRLAAGGQVDRDELARQLIATNALPGHASEQEARVVADSFMLRRDAPSLDASGAKAMTGKQAVGRSSYLARLKKEGSSRRERTLATLFTQRVRDRVFRLIGGIWTEEGLETSAPEQRRQVEAFSAEYFRLLRSYPELRPFLAFRTRIILRFEGGVLEVVEAPARVQDQAVR